MHSVFKNAFADLQRQGIEYRVAGFVWMQGEADTKHNTSADTYPQSLKRLKARVEEDFNNGDPIPMVFGQVMPQISPSPKYVARELTRKRMAETDQDSDHDNAIDGCKMISTDDFPCLPDRLHFNAKGQWLLGSKFAKQLLDLTKGSTEK